MSKTAAGQFIQQMRVSLGQSSIAPLADDQLLERYLQQQDAVAFAELVRRHGAMVLAVCVRVLGRYHDAEDAFQATFLVLAQKADSVWPRNKLASWLYGVAYRTALRAKALLRKHPSDDGTPIEAIPQTSQSHRVHEEAIQVLDEELQRLPEKYRLPILLCELQGRTRKSVADLLGWPEGTVAGRLARGRDLLAARLTRRGIVLPATGLLGLLQQQAAEAHVSHALVHSTTKFASLVGMGESSVSAFPGSIQTLSDGVLRTMWFTKCKIVAVTVACCFCLGMGLQQFGPGLAIGEDNPSTAKQDRSHKPKQPDMEPIDLYLLFQKHVQEELRLSPNQINKINEAWEKGKEARAEDAKKVDEIGKQIEELEAQIAKLREQQNVHAAKVNDSRQAKLKSSLPQILSSTALDQLRKITMRQMSLRDILLDPRLQAKLKLNDEQLKKIQEFSSASRLSFTQYLGQDSGKIFRLNTSSADSMAELATYFLMDSSTSVEGRNALLKLLTPSQRKVLEELGGESFRLSTEEKK